MRNISAANLGKRDAADVVPDSLTPCHGANGCSGRVQCRKARIFDVSGCSIESFPGAFVEPECYRVDAGFYKRDPTREGQRPCHYMGNGEAYRQVEAQVRQRLGGIAGHAEFLSQCKISESRGFAPMIASGFLDRLLCVQPEERRAAKDGADWEEGQELRTS
jgi:hypothetical protein